MSVEELSKFTAISKYARHIKELNRRELWPETVARSRDMFIGMYPQFEDTLREVYTDVEQMNVLGSQRCMQFGGEAIVKRHAKMYNCWGSYCDRLRFFQEALWLLLCGGGVGFSVQFEHIKYLPDFSQARQKGKTLPSKTFTIPDNIEGWSDALGVLLSSFFDQAVFGEYADCHVKFDYSQIRPKGSPLSFGIGKAPGPEPLLRSLEKIRELLIRCLRNKQTRLRTIDAYDIVMHAADAVVSGGVRRSATICLFSPDDADMMSAKTGNWVADNLQRGRSNNTQLIVRASANKEQFDKSFECTKQFGEPGFGFTNRIDYIFNPCSEIQFYCYFLVRRDTGMHTHLMQNYQGPVIHDSQGENVLLSGWQACNLCTINGKSTLTTEEFLRRCVVASTIGTFQASLTSFAYLGSVSESIVRKESLLGISINGVMHTPAVLLDEDVQREGALVVRRTNEEWATKLQINPAARLTCVKPEGNSSCLLGTNPGIHATYAKRYFRGVQITKIESPYQYFKSINPEACEESAWNPNKTDDFIRFCVEPPEGSLLKADMTPIDFLDHVKSTQINWVGQGCVEERCSSPGMNHNVSNTVPVPDGQWDAVRDHLWEHREHFGGVSFLSDSGELDYIQAPYTAVLSKDELSDMYAPAAIKDAFEAVQGCCRSVPVWMGHNLALEPTGTKLHTDEVGHWAEVCVKLANTYFNGDIREGGYLLKRAFLWNLWEHLKASYKPVDYSKMVETEDNVSFEGESACAGGSCQI